MLLEACVRYSHVFRSGNDDTQSGLIHVVLHAEVSGHSVNQHPIVGRHVGEFVRNFLPIFRKLDQVLLDLQEHASVLLIAVNSLRYKLL